MLRDRTARILEQLKSGSTYAAIGAEFGVTRQRIHQLAKRFGLDEERRERRAQQSGVNRRPLTRREFAARKARLRHAVSSVAKGMQVTDAAIKHKVPYMQLSAAMKAAGVRASAERQRRAYSEREIAAVLDLVAKSDLNDDEIAWETGVSALAVRGLRRRLPFMKGRK